MKAAETSRTKVRYRTRSGVFTVRTPDSWSRREAPMKSWTAEIVVSAVVALVLGGCATSQEWSDWKSHPTHFASGEHRSEERRVGKEWRVGRETERLEEALWDT